MAERNEVISKTRSTLVQFLGNIPIDGTGNEDFDKALRKLYSDVSDFSEEWQEVLNGK